MRPRIAWTTQVASFQSRNNILADGERLLVGSSGLTWNVPDEADGVSAIACATGDLLWFAATDADTNEIAVIGGVLIVPCDSGSVYGIDPQSGRQLWVRQLPDRVLARPMRVTGMDENTALLVTVAGEMFRTDVRYGAFHRIAHLHQGVRANPVIVTSDPRRPLLIATEAGMLVKYDLLSSSYTRLGFADYSPYAGSPDESATGLIHSSPALAGDTIVFGFARDTYYTGAALTCISLDTGAVRWTEPKALSSDFGNCRTTPLICGDQVVCAFAYSAGLDIFNLSTGTHEGFIALGQTVFQQWSSPLKIAPDLIAIGRVDGVVSVVNLQSRTLVASISIATALSEELTRDPSLRRLGNDDTFDLRPGEPPKGGICMTPLFYKGSLYVGDTSGVLTKVDLGIAA